MKVEQIYLLMNDVTKEILGKTGIVKEDSSNTVDLFLFTLFSSVKSSILFFVDNNNSEVDW